MAVLPTARREPAPASRAASPVPVAPASLPPASRPEVPRILVTITVMLGLIMAIIDTSIVNVALTNMAGTLGATIDEIGWVATGYILANVIVMPLNGWLTARLGRRNFYAACLVIFTVASFLCGTASNVWLLVAYRVLQGLGGGALQPTAQAILFETYPPRERAGAMAIFGMGAMVGPALGPTLGGVIVDNYSWPLIFYINIPIGIAALVMTMLYVRDPVYVKRESGPIDLLGLGLMAAGLGSLQFVLERGQREDWFASPTIVIMTVVSIITLVMFVVRQLRDPHPLVDLSVFRSRSFTAGNILGIVTGFGLFGTAFILPLFFQNVLGFDATTTGFALLPGAIATALSMPIASTLARRFDGRALITVGMVMFAVSCWWMGGLTPASGEPQVFWPRALQGFALGFIFVPLSTATLSEIARDRMSNATGIYTLVRQLGGSIGIALLELYEERRQDIAHQALASGVNLSNNAVRAFLDGAGSQVQKLQALAAQVQVNALTVAYDDVLRLCAIIFAVTIPAVLLLRSNRDQAAAAAAVQIE